MKSSTLGFIGLVISSCVVYKLVEEPKVKKLDLTNYASSEYEFAVIVHELNTNQYCIYNDSLSKIQYSPASTFKIANSIVALEAGVISNETFELPWDGVQRSNPAWNQTQDLNFAFKNSSVWFFQEIARRIGTQKMMDGLKKINYCDSTFSIKNDIDEFWLNGNLKKSLNQQIQFLDNLASEKLKIQKNTYRTMEKIMASDTLSNAHVYSKTGWAVEGNVDIGWFVGYLTKNNKKYVFGTILTTKNYEKVDIRKLRKEITIYALHSLKIIN